MKRLLPILALVFGGCATVTLNTTCPADSTGVGFALSGSAVGNQLLSMLGGAMAAGKLMALKDTAPVSSGTMTYRYVPIFGADSGSLTCAQPLTPPPAPVIVTTGPPAAILH